MTPEIQARVFEPFFTTKGAEGTGLGLANVFATMLRHGGSVSLDTAPGKGATFTLSFPLATG
jgi:signal transduction histidine kinase